MFGEAEGEKKQTNLSLRQNVYSDYLNQVPKQVFDFKNEYVTLRFELDTKIVTL